MTVIDNWEAVSLKLCWGGPKHGECVSVPNKSREWIFPISRPTSYKISEVTAESAIPHIATVRYDMERVYGGGQLHRVLVYGENRERHMERLVDVVNALLGACTLGWML